MVDMTTEKNMETQSWCSGEWKTTPRKNVPYNGVEIIGVPLYDENGRFVSADIVVADCTNVKEGVQSKLAALSVEDGWLDIPPIMMPGSPPVDDPRFTVKGKLQLRHGSGSMLLGVDFAYGLAGQRHEELGFIFGFPTNSNVKTDSGEAGPSR